MGIYENIKVICKDRHCSINKLEQDLGFARSSVMKFNQNSPSVNKIQQIADYLCVSTDEIINGKKDGHDFVLIEKSEMLTDSNKARLMAYLQALLDTQE